MSVAPYWGQLPAPKVRRASGDFDQDQPDRRHSHQQPDPSRRSSTQTRNTDTPTESTFSPIASPTSWSFQPAGLTPRPPSFSRAQQQGQLPPELIEKRRRRTSRNNAENAQGLTNSAQPATTNLSKGPPVSYNHSTGNGGIAYNFPASGQPGPPHSSYTINPPAKNGGGDMEPEALYNDITPPSDQYGPSPVPDHSQHTFDNGGGDAKRMLSRHAADSQSMRQPATGNPHERPQADDLGRRGSLAGDANRKIWADDRSPLQRLELTLDSITKEEKRARVEAAERRARERAAANAGAVGGGGAGGAGNGGDRLMVPPERSGSQQVRFRDRRAPLVQDEKSRPVAANPILVQLQPSVAPQAGSLQSVSPPHHSPEPRRRQYEPPRQPPGSHIPSAMNRNVSAAQEAALPQRNLSFRERAAKNEAELPKEAKAVSPADSPRASPGSGFALTRRGSNKLRKNPPGDPWYTARRDMEEQAISAGRAHVTSPEGAGKSRDPPADVMRTRSIDGPGKRPPPSHAAMGVPPSRGKQHVDSSLGRSNSMPAVRRPLPYPPANGRSTSSSGNGVRFAGVPPPGEDDSEPSGRHHHFGGYTHRDRHAPSQTVYQSPQYLSEWEKATVGTLSSSLLDINSAAEESDSPVDDKNAAWWENTSKSKRRNSASKKKGPPKQRRIADAYVDEPHDDGHTKFTPPLYLKCGPLLRYCGIRHDGSSTLTNRNGALVAADREFWRGSIMVVTQDSESTYEPAPTLRLFVQPMELLPPPPTELRGSQSLAPEYVDPIAGIPKLGRRGETLYVKPIEHLEEGKDVSMLEPDDGLFEITRTPPDFDPSTPDPPGSFTSRSKRRQLDGEKVGKYKDVRGFRLNAERGCTFWRFNIEVELRDQQQRIAYRINRGPATAFWVPARGRSMNVMFHSCNGFSLVVNPDDLSGPDPMWRDVLNNHQTRPFHVMIGGGDQIYNDAVMNETHHFREWVRLKNPLHKRNAPFTAEMQAELESYYLERYSMWFSRGLFSLANSQIPMVNMYDDHDIIDGFGSYPHHFMKCPVFSGLGNVAFKYYMLFQHQSLPTETAGAEPSWCLGSQPGPYINEPSHSVFVSLGGNMALVAVDCRTERTQKEVVREDTWKSLMDRCYDEIVKGKTQHLLVLLGVPIAYPRLVWLENILTSRLMDPVKALGKTGLLGNFLNNFDGGVEVLDDLDDHWTARNHKEERKFIIEDLQDLAADKSCRVTILSGDVHLAAVGRFYSNPKLELAKHKDFRYMANVISSAIANTPPPDLMADVLNKRNKIHHFDKETEEDMIPLFANGVDGKLRNNKHLLPHRNWCSIREYQPGSTPPPTPPPEEYDEGSPVASPPVSRGGSLLRRLSLSRSRGPAAEPAEQTTTDRSRPPLSGGSFLSSFPRRRDSVSSDARPKGRLMRTLSLGRGESFPSARNLFRRNSIDRRPDDGGINGSWGPDSDEDQTYDAPPLRPPQQQQRGAVGRPTTSRGPPTMSLRGGAGDPRDLHGMNANTEYEAGDDSYFSARPTRRAFTQPVQGKPSYDDDYEDDDEPPRQPPNPFRRAPTDLSAKQLLRKKGRAAANYAVDLEGGLDVCLNVEVNSRDPAGITMPYRLLVPRLWHEEEEEPDGDGDGVYDADVGATDPPGMAQRPGGGGLGGGLKRLFSGRGSQYRARRGGEEAAYAPEQWNPDAYRMDSP
ncbi:hypothetical protein DL764_001277 [Monosporascus ibericus]|uniref:PhoD-like phosphatase domain-containing protein n=1 Tax=Monosporascus ibericus TaxID=155417 RepID=A0A4Q4TRY1_9PEZI|nr:hypothetical protein DL764_001277 [Monosporascus ibericus]